ncbi:kinase-like protein [Neolentinus lepideus HHB14362 ss-1]|uniref:Kinase-like protein n=1 Tax=Neolentinus lepideus HHB14362 ss-1 TaxID=1314782 RepID=A0A165PD76_9AGAM|nr:kinase-like protein [Neolentinus lepideus HHB14362 ss-1]
MTRMSQSCQELPSSLFIDDVELVSSDAISGGGFSDIFRGYRSDGDVALKRLRIFHALLWQTLDHANVLPFLGVDAVSFQPQLCFVSPWMFHGDVLKYMKTNGPLNVVHGDLRAGNILIDRDWHVRLADFGLAVVVDYSRPSSKRGGTVRWMAPELLHPEIFGRDFKRTTASDIYALGLVSYLDGFFTPFQIYTIAVPFSNIRSEGEVILRVIDGLRPTFPTLHVMGGLFLRAYGN